MALLQCQGYLSMGAWQVWRMPEDFSALQTLQECDCQLDAADGPASRRVVVREALHGVIPQQAHGQPPLIQAVADHLHHLVGWDAQILQATEQQRSQVAPSHTHVASELPPQAIASLVVAWRIRVHWQWDLLQTLTCATDMKTGRALDMNAKACCVVYFPGRHVSQSCTAVSSTFRGM